MSLEEKLGLTPSPSRKALQKDAQYSFVLKTRKIYEHLSLNLVMFIEKLSSIINLILKVEFS